MNSKTSLDYLEEDLSIIVIGASGDLAKKKVFPALFDLLVQDLLPPNALIWGYARSHLTSDTLRQQLKPYLLQKQTSLDIVNSFLSMCHYQRGESYGDGNAWESLSLDIRQQEDDVSRQNHCNNSLTRRNRLFYMAIPPNLFADTGLAIKQANLFSQASGWSRLVLEKPFGRDLQSCRQLLATLSNHFEEHQMYRIDHYLGKEVVQNLIHWRFGNSLWEPMWNRKYIRSIHISFKETFGTQGRGGYFDNYGIIRDILQNHLLQVLVLLTMEAPVRLDEIHCCDHVRNEKVKLLQAIQEIELHDCLLGQYEGYHNDATISNKESNTPTYAAVRCFINSSRWYGVPFLLEAGKALDQHVCGVCVNFAPMQSHRFQHKTLPNNTIVFRLQPDPCISITTNIKTPGLSSVPTSASMHLQYDRHKIPDAYTRLLIDALRGQQSSFVRADELERSWEIFTPLLHRIEQDGIRPHIYPYGSAGPTQREEFLRASNIHQSGIMRSAL